MRLLLITALLCPLLSMCQPLPIKGKVIDEEGIPISGATVLLKRTRESTITDDKGYFSFPDGKPRDTLVVSSIGYQAREVPNNERGLLTIILYARSVSLEDVMINTGFQKLPRERSTGSFTQISKKLLNEQTGSFLMDRLEPIANGVTVDRKSNSGGIMVRGLSTIRGPRSPLIVIDNFPYEGEMENVNPNDVESITILKDAAAASIWGTRAGNGVIVITTKKGRFNHPLTVSFNSNYTITKEPDLQYFKQISSADFIDVETFLYGKGFYNSQVNSSSRPVLSPVVEILLDKTSGRITATEADALISEMKLHDVRNDYQKYFYGTGRAAQYSLGLSGGNASYAWLASAGYDRNFSTVNDQYNRLNVRLENQVRLTTDLQLTMSVFYTDSRNGKGNPVYGSVVSTSRLFPYARFADEGGNPLPLVKDYRSRYIDTAGGGKLLDWRYYPLTDSKYIDDEATTRDLLSNLGLRWKILPGLQLEMMYQNERQLYQHNTQYMKESYYARNMVNLFSQLNRTTGSVSYKIPKGGILDYEMSQLQANNLRGQLNFSRSGKDHAVNLLAGGEIREGRIKSNANRAYGYDADILAQAYVDYVNPYPTFIRGTNSFITGRAALSALDNRNVSAYANAAYTFRQKYTATISGRRDASNMFGVETNHKWQPLWSAGVAWELSKENFYHSEKLKHLRFRLTYGYSGNVDPSMTAVTTINYQSVNSPYTQSPFASIKNFSNPDLRWEKTATLNIGADFRAFGDRLRGSIEYFRKNSTDLFGYAAVDYTAGLGLAAVMKNVASIRAQGIDAEINTVNIDAAFKWTTSLNLDYYKDRVLDNYQATQQGKSFIYYGEGLTAVEGRPVYAYYSYQWGGLDPATGDPIGYYRGQPSKDYAALTGNSTLISDMVYNGPQFPTIYGSLGNTFSWKNISVTGRITYKFGHYGRRQSIGYNSLYSSWLGHPDFSNRWQKPGDELITDVPSMIYPAVSARDAFYLGSETLIFKADNIRLQYIDLKYDIVRKLKSFPFQNLQLYVNAQNLGILWKADNYINDPDYRESNLPLSSSYTLGIRATL